MFRIPKIGLGRQRDHGLHGHGHGWPERPRLPKVPDLAPLAKLAPLAPVCLRRSGEFLEALQNLIRLRLLAVAQMPPVIHVHHTSITHTHAHQ
jgi:hypothetical protein